MPSASAAQSAAISLGRLDGPDLRRPPPGAPSAELRGVGLAPVNAGPTAGSMAAALVQNSEPGRLGAGLGRAGARRCWSEDVASCRSRAAAGGQQDDGGGHGEPGAAQGEGSAHGAEASGRARVGDRRPATVPDVTAPVDPRAGWDLPAPGPMTRTAELEPLVTRVLAPNPGRDEPRRHQHLRRRRAGQRAGRAGRPRPGRRRAPGRGRGGPGRPRTPVRRPCWSPTTTATTPRRRCRGAPHFGAQVAAGSRRGRRARAAGCSSRGSGSRLAGTTIGVVPTPGHTADHLAFRLESGAVLVGDHVLGRGHVGGHPSRRATSSPTSSRCAGCTTSGPSALYCGHGPELTEDPGAVLDFYLAHRAYREHQLLDGARPRARRRSTSWWRRSTPRCPRRGVAGRGAVDPGDAGQAARRGPGRGRRTSAVRLA